MVFWAFLYRFLFISLYLTSCCAYHRSIAGSYSVHPCRARTNGKFKRNECVCVCVVRLGIREFYFTIYLNYVTPFLLLLLLWLATAVTHAPQTFRTCRYMHIAFVYVFFLSRFSNPYGAWIVCWAQDAPTVDAHTRNQFNQRRLQSHRTIQMSILLRVVFMWGDCIVPSRFANAERERKTKFWISNEPVKQCGVDERRACITLKAQPNAATHHTHTPHIGYQNTYANDLRAF